MMEVLGSSDGKEKEHLVVFCFFNLYVLRNGGGLFSMNAFQPCSDEKLEKWTERQDRRARLPLGLWSFFLQDNGPILIYYYHSHLI